LQHVLPDHFVKVRYYGLLSPSNRPLLEKARQALGAQHTVLANSPAPEECDPRESVRRCPDCGSPLILLQRILSQWRRPP
jgi:hypothetical protein